MKTLPLLAALTFTAASVHAQSQVVSSEVAGFVNFNVGAESQLTFKSVGLVRPVEYKGFGDAASPTTLHDVSATWQTGEFNPADATSDSATHYLEITSGPRAGSTFDIVATDGPARTLTLGQTLPDGFTGSFSVRKYWTLASLFGAQNEVGLTAGTALTADKILIYNGTAYDTYFYSTDQLIGAGWRRVGDGARDHAGRKLYPDEALIFRRAGGDDIQQLIKGVARTSATSVPVFPGMNVLGNVYAVPMTLASCRLYTGDASTGVRAGEPGTADQVLIHNGAGYDTYYYSLASTPGWRKVGDLVTDRSTTQIPAGGALVLKRAGDTGFDWKVPAHPAQ